MDMFQKKDMPEGFSIFRKERNMAALIAFPISMIPMILLFLFVRNKAGTGEEWKRRCKAYLLKGLPTVLLALLFSFIFNLIEAFSGIRNTNPVLVRLFHAFIVLALAEELSKGYNSLKVLKKEKAGGLSWLDFITAFMIVAMAFGVLESIAYAFATNPIQMFVRGITGMHAGYGFITGWFYGKGIRDNSKVLKITGFLISLFLHGLYDWMLDPNVLELTEWIAVAAVSIAFLGFVLFVFMFFFYWKAGRNPKYTEPLIPAEEVKEEVPEAPQA